jgi:hypothetical protein
MFSSDAHINLSVERSIERRRAVQAYGLRGGAGSTPSSDETGHDAAVQRLAIKFAAALLAVIVFVGLVLAVQGWV